MVGGCSNEQLSEIGSRPASTGESQPNIIIILADDMGFSDAGFAGGEIDTPNIDKLAQTGIVFPNFYNSARCYPTRASLLSGKYHHAVGMGGDLQMIKRNGGILPTTPPGPYQGYLDRATPTLPERLREVSYKNYMVGKWHLGIEKKSWPTARGFDHYFGPVTGIDNYFSTSPLNDNFQRFYLKDDERWESNSPDFYATDAFTDQATAYIQNHSVTAPDTPFFLYVAYTAPHWPLHAKEHDIEKYEKIYQQGWEAIRSERLVRAKQNGIIGEDVVLPPFPNISLKWDELSKEERDVWVRRMATYAAMVDSMDKGIGQIMDVLESSSLNENTVIMFFSDNGAASVNITNNKVYKNIFLNGPSVGLAGSADSVRLPWASVSNTPFKRYKGNMYEGGTRTPLVINWPAHIKPLLANQVAHVIDIVPTTLNLAGIDTGHDNNLPGVDLIPFFDRHAETDRSLYWEHYGHRAIRHGHWKLVGEPEFLTPKLYDLKSDPTEQRDIFFENGNKAVELAKLWSQWARRQGLKEANWEW